MTDEQKPENMAQLVHKLYEDNKNLRDQVIEEKDKRIEQLEQQLEGKSEENTKQVQVFPDGEGSESEEEKPFKNLTPSQAVNELSERHRDLVKELDDEYKSSTELGDDLEVTPDTAKSYYTKPKKLGLVETKLGSGVRLTGFGHKVKSILTGTKSEKKVELNREQLAVLSKFDLEDWGDMRDVADTFSGKSRWDVKQICTQLKDKGLLEAQRGMGTRLTEKGVEYLEEHGEVQEKEESQVSKQKDQGFLPHIKNLYGTQPKITRLNTSERQQLQELYLTKEKSAKSIDKTCKELYGVKRPRENDSVRNMVYRAYNNNDNVEDMPAMGDSREKVYYVEEAKQEMIESYEDEAAVEKAKEKFDEMIDGASKYTWIKTAFGKLAPIKGQRKEITFKSQENKEGFTDYFTAPNPSADTRAWQDLCTSTLLQKALKKELEMPDADIKLKKSSGGNPVTNTILVVDRIS